MVLFISTHFNISVHYNLRQELKITDVGDCDTNLECVNTCEGVVDHILYIYVDPWDMLNKFCFHVYAQKSLFLAENCNAFFYHIIIP